MRIEKECATTNQLSAAITDKVIELWQRLRVLTLPRDGCIKRVCAAIEMWKKMSHRVDNLKSDEFKFKLKELLDIKPKRKGFGHGGDNKGELEYLKEIMKSMGKQKIRGFASDKSDHWKTDYNFYIDQYQVCAKLSCKLIIINLLNSLYRLVCPVINTIQSVTSPYK